jgi:hypothetical protein
MLGLPPSLLLEAICNTVPVCDAVALGEAVHGGLHRGLLIRLDVEVDEEEEIAREEGAAEKRSTLGTGT